VIIQPQGKPATRFISMTQNGAASNLVQVCTNLIMSSQAVAYVENEIAGGVPFPVNDRRFRTLPRRCVGIHSTNNSKG